MQVEADNPLTDAQANQYLTFILGGEEYAVDILKVQEIRGWEQATHIPNAPEFVLGVLNLRGIVVPIVDLRLRFKLENVEYSPTTVVVIVKVSQAGVERTVGMVVDAVSDVYTLTRDDIRETPDFGGSLSTEYVYGLATVDEKMIVILNVDRLVNSGILGLHDEIDAASVDAEVDNSVRE